MKRQYGKALVNLAVALCVLLLVIFVLPGLLAFFLPFVIGWLISLVAGPLVLFLEQKLKIRRRLSGVVVIASVIASVILLFYAVFSKLARELSGFLQSLPALWKSVESDFDSIGRNLNGFYDRLPQDMQDWMANFGLNAEDYIRGLIGELSTPTVSAVGSLAQNLPSVLIGVIMCLLAAYFFVADKEAVYAFFRGCMPPAMQEKWKILSDSLRQAVGGYLKAQLKIEVWIYLLVVIGLVILRIDYSLLIALGIAALDLLPVFGTGAVLWPWAIVKFLSGDYVMGVGLLLIWGVGQLVRQIIQPKIVGDSIGLAPMPTLVLLYVGYRIGSVLGMILAIPIGIVVVNLYRAGAFDSTVRSIRILTDGINEFRRLDDADGERNEKL